MHINPRVQRLILQALLYQDYFDKVDGILLQLGKCVDFNPLTNSQGQGWIQDFILVVKPKSLGK